ncbi:hypothetical protein J6590_001742, partial [Homalodisca vitripennis]
TGSSRSWGSDWATPMFDLAQLQLRSRCTDRVTLCNLINGVLDCPGLFGSIAITLTRGARSKTIFLKRYLPTSYHTIVIFSE